MPFRLYACQVFHPSSPGLLRLYPSIPEYAALWILRFLKAQASRWKTNNDVFRASACFQARQGNFPWPGKNYNREKSSENEETYRAFTETPARCIVIWKIYQSRAVLLTSTSAETVAISCTRRRRIAGVSQNEWDAGVPYRWQIITSPSVMLPWNRWSNVKSFDV